MENNSFRPKNNIEEKEKVFATVLEWLKEEKFYLKEISNNDKRQHTKKFVIFLKNSIHDRKGIYVFFSPVRKDLIIISVSVTLERDDLKALFALPPSVQTKFQKKIETTFIKSHIRCLYEYDVDKKDILILLYKLIYFDNLTKDRLVNFIHDIFDGIRLFEIEFEDFIDNLLSSKWENTINK